MSEDNVTSSSTGFPSPAQDYLNEFIDLNKELARHPAATFFARVTSSAMKDAGVDEGDVLVIDKAIEPQEGDLAVCFVDGEFALKILSFTDPSLARFEDTPAGRFANLSASPSGTSADRSGQSARQNGQEQAKHNMRMRKAAPQKISYGILPHDKVWLLSPDKSVPAIEVSEPNDFTLWGVVTYVIKKTCTR